MHRQHRAQGVSASTAAPAAAGSLRADRPVPDVGAPGHRPEPEPVQPAWHRLGDQAAPDRPHDPLTGAGPSPTAEAAGAPAVGQPPDAEPAAVDVRALARASLAAGRSPSLWWVCTGILLTVVVSATAGAAEGSLLLAVLLCVSAVARAVLPRGPVALTVRSRALDTAVLLGLALGVGILSQVIPSL